MSTLSTVPPLLEIAISETRIWPLDVTPTIASMGLGAPTTPTVTVVDPVTGLAVAGAVGTSPGPSASGNVITAVFVGSVLTIGKAYRIQWIAVCSGQTLLWVTQLNVVA